MTFVQQGKFLKSKEELTTSGLQTCVALAFHAGGENFMAHIDANMDAGEILKFIKANFNISKIPEMHIIKGGDETRHALLIAKTVANSLSMKLEEKSCEHFGYVVSISSNGLKIDTSEVDNYYKERAAATGRKIYSKDNTSTEEIELKDSINKNIVIYDKYGSYNAIYNVSSFNKTEFSDIWAIHDSEGKVHKIYISENYKIASIAYANPISAKQFYSADNEVFLRDSINELTSPAAISNQASSSAPPSKNKNKF